MEYTPIIKLMSNGWYFAQCEQVPGAMTQGETVEEALENLQEAIQLVLEAERERGIIAVPRHREIGDVFCNEICKQLGIPKIK
ncbi:MAG: type II toxin-antitoxin system HicB family antitoxin [Marinilabiliaceae bacterium]|nr:type II toxin-antitoxin system HicB family antitoxin [Marinilabiliaceae bacterium]